MTGTSDAFAHPASILALGTFRLNGALIALGDAITAPSGLTSARWQVLGAISEARGALPVSGIARNMGLVRQSVEKIVDDLVRVDLLELVPNPHHRRAKLVQLTAHGAALFEEVNVRWLGVADSLVADLDTDDIERGVALLRLLRDRVETMHPSRAVDLADDAERS